MKNKKLLALIVIVLLAIMVLTACGSASASGGNVKSVPTNRDVTILTPIYYIANDNNRVIYEVVSFEDEYGRKCTAVLSVYTDAGPALFCQ